MQNKKVFYSFLGNIDYPKAWAYQEKIFQTSVQQKTENRLQSSENQVVTSNYLLFCEHPHVYTLGKSGDRSHLLIDQALLAEKQATYFEINRGGDITYHGPGQLVGYPILDLDHFFTDIHKYLRFLEEAVILTLAEYGMKAGRVEGLTGVWLGIEPGENARKICAMGVRASRWVTMHGFALNVNTDLSYFGHIVPCGIQDKAVTSLEAELGHTVSLSEVADKLKKHIAQLFDMEIIEQIPSFSTLEQQL